jgi:hypothetical protein
MYNNYRNKFRLAMIRVLNNLDLIYIFYLNIYLSNHLVSVFVIDVHLIYYINAYRKIRSMKTTNKQKVTNICCINLPKIYIFHRIFD